MKLQFRRMPERAETLLLAPAATCSSDQHLARFSWHKNVGTEQVAAVPGKFHNPSFQGFLKERR